MIGNNVDKIGVELEGYWKHNPSGFRIHGDSSIELSSIRERRLRRDNTNPHPRGTVGEKSSPVFATLNDLKVWLFREYPHRRNFSCGFHINISLSNPTLLQECNVRYIHDAMIKAILRYGKIKRLGRAFKQRATPSAEYSDIRYDSQDKYRAINWSKTYNDTPYLEFRIFSQSMPKEKAMNAVCFLCELMNLVAELVKDVNMSREDRSKKIMLFGKNLR